MSVNYSAQLSPYDNKGKCGMPETKDSDILLKEKSLDLVNLIKQSQLTVVHTGAGISTSAGIPDFRGPKGVWTLEKEGKSPECDITFADAVPTFSHRCLVMLEKLGFIQYIVSQNVDGLHVRSGFPRDRLAELHGNMFTQKCQLCKREFVMDTVSPTLGLKLTGHKCIFKKKRGNCRGLLRDTILDWEDALPVDQLELSELLCKAADLSIVIGSSLQIVPAADLPVLTKRNCGKLVIINLQATKHDKKADLLIHGRADDVMKIVAEELGVVVPGYDGPVVCHQSIHPLPDITQSVVKNYAAARKRKKEESPDTELNASSLTKQQCIEDSKQYGTTTYEEEQQNNLTRIEVNSVKRECDINSKDVLIKSVTETEPFKVETTI